MLCQEFAYIRSMKPNTLDDFHSRLIPVEGTGCLIYSGAINHGYGNFHYGNRRWQAHRLAYTLANGPIPDGLVLDHLCRVKSCCNVDHLEAVAQRLNVLRGETVPAKNSAKTHCKYGHLLSGDNLVLAQRGGHLKRNCRTCRNATERLRRSGTPKPF